MLQIPIQRGEYISLDKSERRPGEYLIASNASYDGLMYFTPNQLRELRNAITQTLGDHDEVTPESIVAQAGAMNSDQLEKIINCLVPLWLEKEDF